MKVLKFLVTIIVGVNKRAKLVLRRPDHVGTKQEWKKKKSILTNKDTFRGKDFKVQEQGQGYSDA